MYSPVEPAPFPSTEKYVKDSTPMQLWPILLGACIVMAHIFIAYIVMAYVTVPLPGKKQVREGQHTTEQRGAAVDGPEDREQGTFLAM